MSKINVLETKDKMQHFIVEEKLGQSMCFELFNEIDHTFVLSCAMDKYMQKGVLVFSTLKDCHLRSFSDILSIVDNKHPDFVARMIRDGMGGLKFSLFDRCDLIVCDIRFMSSIFERLPISFKMKLYTSADYNHSERFVQSTKTYTKSVGLFSCMTDYSCFEDTNHVEGGESSTSVQSTANYTSIDSSNLSNNDIVYLQTKKPSWNREIKHWMHNFGGRVKFPSNRNFLVVQTVSDEYDNIKGSNDYHIPRCAIDEQHANVDRVCIRHGKTSVNTYILDCRAPISILAAFSAMCSTHTAKPFVKV